MKKKIGIIVQRYGSTINGGAEVHAKMIAEKLSSKYDVSVLTSCAVDYHTWMPVLPEGESFENNIKIIRFKSGKLLTEKEKTKISRKLRGRHLTQKFYRWLGKPQWWFYLFPNAEITEKDHFDWMKTQGPYIPELIEFLKLHKNQYSSFIFFTAAYFPTAAGIMTVPEKSILIPLIHDEPASYLQVFKNVIEQARWVFFNTKAEQNFCNKLLSIDKLNKKVVAVGIDIPDSDIDKNILKEFNIETPYLIYIGRIDTFKGCDKLIENFETFKAQENTNLKLVLVGKNMMNIKPSPSVILTGFVSEKVKEQLLKQAEALIIPSEYESLSLVLLESFSCKIPVIVNGKTQVLTEHIELSNGGWCYNNYDEFKYILLKLAASESLKIEKGNHGFEYVKRNYNWNNVVTDYYDAINDCEKQTL